MCYLYFPSMQFQIISVCYRSLRTCFEIRLGKRYAKIPAEYNLSTSQVPIEKITHCQIWQQSQMPSLTYSLPNRPFIFSEAPTPNMSNNVLGIGSQKWLAQGYQMPNNVHGSECVNGTTMPIFKKKKKAMFTLEAYNSKMSQPQKQTLH